MYPPKSETGRCKTRESIRSTRSLPLICRHLILPSPLVVTRAITADRVELRTNSRRDMSSRLAILSTSSWSRCAVRGTARPSPTCGPVRHRPSRWRLPCRTDRSTDRRYPRPCLMWRQGVRLSRLVAGMGPSKPRTALYYPNHQGGFCHTDLSAPCSMRGFPPLVASAHSYSSCYCHSTLWSCHVSFSVRNEGPHSRPRPATPSGLCRQSNRVSIIPRCLSRRIRFASPPICGPPPTTRASPNSEFSVTQPTRPG